MGEAGNLISDVNQWQPHERVVQGVSGTVHEREKNSESRITDIKTSFFRIANLRKEGIEKSSLELERMFEESKIVKG